MAPRRAAAGLRRLSLDPAILAGVRSAGSRAPNEPVLENEYYRVEFDPAGGAITRLLVKADHWEALERAGQRRGPGGGPRRLVGALQAARRRQPHRHEDASTPSPQPGQAVFSNEQADPPGTVTPRAGLLRVQRGSRRSARKARSPRPSACTRACDGIDIRTQILNNDQFVRYRVLFPTSIRTAGASTRSRSGRSSSPAAIEFPAQNWIDYGNGQQGLALLNRGLPGNNVSDGTMMLSLAAQHADRGLRLRRRLRAGHVVRLGPGIGQGVHVRLRAGSARRRLAAGGRLSRRDGVQPSVDGLARCARTPASCPIVGGSLEIAPPNVVLTALKPGRGRHGRAAGLRGGRRADQSDRSAVAADRRGRRSQSHGGPRPAMSWPTTHCNSTCDRLRSRRSSCGWKSESVAEAADAAANARRGAGSR